MAARHVLRNNRSSQKMAAFPSLSHSVNHLALTEAQILTFGPQLSSVRTGHRPILPRLLYSRALRCLSSSSLRDDRIAPADGGTLHEASPPAKASPISGAEDVLMGFVMGKRKATELAHSLWKNVVRKGDVVVDATCGNGYDTLALLKLVADESDGGSVYGMDIQKSALMNTYSLLDQSVNHREKARVKLFHCCHSKMEDVIPKETPVRLVAFNLGYLPGGDKAVITASQSTNLALHSASRLLESGGLISVVVYVGHNGGREEFGIVQSFASSLPTDCWVTCKFEVLNRPNAPVLILFSKK